MHLFRVKPMVLSGSLWRQIAYLVTGLYVVRNRFVSWLRMGRHRLGLILFIYIFSCRLHADNWFPRWSLSEVAFSIAKHVLC